MQTRDLREQVTIPAQIQVDGSRSSVTIRNVSSNGVMLSGSRLPTAGSYVEILRGTLVIVGRAVWTAGNLCGVRTKGRLNGALLKRGCSTRSQRDLGEPSQGCSHAAASWPHNMQEPGAPVYRQLQRVHEDLIYAIKQLEHFMSSESESAQTLTDVRWRLMRTSAVRLRFVETKVYPFLAGLVSNDDWSIIERLRNESFALRAVSAAHVAAWTIDIIVKDWSGYARASAIMREAMLARVDREKAILYPLLQKTSVASMPWMVGKSASGVPLLKAS